MEGGCGAYAEPAEGVVNVAEGELVVKVNLRHRRDLKHFQNRIPGISMLLIVGRGRGLESVLVRCVFI